MTNRCEGKCHCEAPLEDGSVAREMDSRHSQTREYSFFSLPRSVIGWLFLKLYILLYIFFFLAKEKIGICILTTGMTLSKTPSQKHDRHTQVHIMSRQSSEPLTGTDVGFPLPVSTTFPQVSEPKGRKKGGVWGHFFNGYILKG